MSPELEATAAPTEESAWGIGLSGRVVVSFTVTGGLLFGGFWVAWLTLSHRIGDGDLILASTERFLLGAALGLVHGLALGYHGRDAGITKRWTAWAEVRAAIFTLPALAVAWPVTGWIAGTEQTWLDGGIGPTGLTLAAWLAGLAMLVYTIAVSQQAVRRAYFRWPNRRSGTSLVAAMLLASLFVAFDVRPDVWGLRLRLTDVALVIAAIMVTIWVTGPIITLALRYSRGTVLRPELGWGRQPIQITLNALLALVVGAALAFVARGFHEVPYLLPTVATGRTAMGTVLATFSHATLDEIFLRFVPITLMACLVTRDHPRRGLGIAAVSILFSVVVQLLLYSPGVTAIGFRSSGTALSYMAQVVALPAAVFGVLLWWRGLGVAWLAHVAWLLAAAAVTTGF